MTRKIRKPVYELTVDDLERHPVWVYALDEEGVEGQDEATVRPFHQRRPLDVMRDTYIVRAEFRLRNGKRLVGAVYARPKAERHLRDLQPAIVTPQGPVLFWHGALRPRKSELAVALRWLEAKTISDAFPIVYQSDPGVRFEASPISGKVTGFYFLKNGKPRRLH